MAQKCNGNRYRRLFVADDQIIAAQDVDTGDDDDDTMKNWHKPIDNET